MCTVSVIPLLSRAGAAGGYRLVCNRDESTRRPEALAPRRGIAGTRRAVWPVDPGGGGTWIGVNDAGVSFSLLNGNPGTRGAPAGDRLSRGRVIPALLAETSARRAAGAARALSLGRFAPFRLVVVDLEELLDLRWNGRRLRSSRPFALSAPAVFSSSGLGDRRVTWLRATLFRQLLSEADDPVRAQARFHAHAWPDRPHLSVVMSRPGARTVSRTTILVSASAARMTYEPLPAEAGYNRARHAPHRVRVPLMPPWTP